MPSRGDLKLEVRISSVDNVQDVSLGDDPVQAYVVVSVPPNPEIRTKRNLIGFTNPTWNETHIIDLVNLDESPTVHIRLHRYNESGGDGLLIGSASLALKKITDGPGYGKEYHLTRQLCHPSGGCQGTFDGTFVLHNTKPPLPTASLMLTGLVLFIAALCLPKGKKN